MLSSIIIIQFVCLFVRDSGKTYCIGRHQTLRDYKVGLQKCPPRVETVHLAVLEEISFNFQFFVRVSLDFQLSGSLRRCRDSGKTYCIGRHQTLRDYKVGLQKCPPRVETVHLAVLEEISFNFQFFVRVSLDFQLSGSLRRCRPVI